MKKYLPILTAVALLFLTTCGPQAPSCTLATGTPRYLTEPPENLPTQEPGNGTSPISLEIAGKTIAVDKVVDGPLCNDAWNGIVYVTCNVLVYQWEEEPTFLKNCNLSIAPGTVVYVAYHNDAAYYNGCSCHTGEIVGP